MTGVLLDMAISLDGAISGPDGADVGLYDWYFDPTPVSRPVVDELVATTGAIVMGRGVWGEGWDESPYDTRHFVITHRPLAPVPGGAVDAVAVEGVRTASSRRGRPRATGGSRSAAARTLPASAWRRDSWTSCSCTSSRSWPVAAARCSRRPGRRYA